MKILNLHDAIELYNLIGEYIPVTPCQDGVEFVSIIVNNIVDANKQIDFMNALLLMTNATQEDLLSLQPQEIISLFVECLAENKILQLVDFCEKVGYHA
jgi:hypothetical protein